MDGHTSSSEGTDESAMPVFVVDRRGGGRLYRWLFLAGVLVFLFSLPLGMFGLYTLPVSAGAFFASGLVGVRWLSRRPALKIGDAVLLGLAGLATFGILSWPLVTPHWYWLYFVGLAVVLGNALLWLRRAPRRKWWSIAFAVSFVVAPMACLRFDNITRSVKAGDVGHARLRLWLGADPNAVDQGDPALIVALSAQNRELAELLLEHGADPNGISTAFGGRTPALFRAIHTRDPAFVELLLDRGANPNLLNHFGETALFHAVRFDQLESVRRLLARGADPMHVARDGQRAGDIAREKGCSEMVVLLTR